MIVEHIQYNKLDDKYDSSIFTMSKLEAEYETAYLSKKHIQNYVFTDGYSEESVERRFAKALDESEDVVVYAKLPRSFQIPTPVGNYAPDWAIAFREGSVKHIYFIAETKGTMDRMQLKPIERAKSDCATALYNKISTSNVRYHLIDSYNSLMRVMKDMD